MTKIIIPVQNPRFPLGQILKTPGADAHLTHEEVAALIQRHVSGDWGELPEDDAAENELALANGSRIMSAYTVRDVKIWLLTEWDRTVTTILLPEEY